MEAFLMYLQLLPYGFLSHVFCWRSRMSATTALLRKFCLKWLLGLFCCLFATSSAQNPSKAMHGQQAAAFSTNETCVIYDTSFENEVGRSQASEIK